MRVMLISEANVVCKRQGSIPSRSRQAFIICFKWITTFLKYYYNIDLDFFELFFLCGVFLWKIFPMDIGRKDLLFSAVYSILGERGGAKRMFERITEETFDAVFPLLEAAFPVTELRIKEEQRGLLQEECYRLYGVPMEDGGYGAVFAVWEIDDFLYIEHFAVKEACRNDGFGGRLLEELLDWKGRKIVLEVEPPEDDLTCRRIGFYERHGLVYNDYPYLQPPLREGQEMLPLRLMTGPFAIDERTFQRYRKRLYSIVYKYEGEKK